MLCFAIIVVVNPLEVLFLHMLFPMLGATHTTLPDSPLPFPELQLGCQPLGAVSLFRPRCLKESAQTAELAGDSGTPRSGHGRVIAHGEPSVSGRACLLSKQMYLPYD